MIEEYDIDNFHFRVLDGDDMFDAVAHSSGGKIIGDEILVENPIVGEVMEIRISKDDILSLYHHCVNVHNNNTNGETNFFMCSDELPSNFDADLRGLLLYKRGHYVISLFSYSSIISSSIRESIGALLRFEREYGDKNSHYNFCDRKINSVEHLYFVDYEKGEILSGEINNDPSSVTLGFFRNCLCFGFEVSLFAAYKKHKICRVFIEEIIGDDVLFSNNIFPLYATQSIRPYNGIGNLYVAFLTEAAAIAELHRLRDGIIDNLYKNVKKYRKDIVEAMKRITFLKNMP